MSRRPAHFTEADLRRAAKVAKEQGVTIVIDTDGKAWVSADPIPAKNRPTPQKREIVL